MSNSPSSSQGSKLQAWLQVALKEKARRKKKVIWTPFPGPQTEALASKADILLYGGAAGGGKTDLMLGAAATAHQISIIFRRQKADLGGIIKRSTEILGGYGSFSAKDGWRLPDGRRIELGGVQLERDKEKYQGRPHDLKAFDEITQFSEAQFRFLIGWNRGADPTQRSRVIAGGNPPTTAEGDWVIRYWAPWLDKGHPNPAKPGELRWFTTIDGKDVELPDGDPIPHPGGKIDDSTGKVEILVPKSRTFIRARVEDNPIYMASGYKATLQSLPEPLRSQMLEGNFGAGQEDDAFQVIPSAWILAAQARWTEDGGIGPMDALGVDVARGGADRTALTPRHGAWFGHQKMHPGKTTPDGQHVVGLVAAEIAGKGKPAINIDVIGVGSSPVDIGRMHELNIVPLNGAAGTKARDKSGQFGFSNQRAEWYWRLREALDPVTGDSLAIPPDRELLADLTAPRFSITVRGIQVESKDDIRDRIGRSPDKGDSLVYAHAIPFVAGMGIFQFMADQAKAAKAGS